MFGSACGIVEVLSTNSNRLILCFVHSITMHPLELFCYQKGLLRLSFVKIKRWHERKDIARLIYAAQHGIYYLRLHCINYLSTYKDDQGVNDQLRHMIDDPVSSVSEAAIALFDKSTDKELKAQIKAARKLRKQKEKSYKSGRTFPPFGQEGPQRPSDRLLGMLRDHQGMNHPPF